VVGTQEQWKILSKEGVNLGSSYSINCWKFCNATFIKEAEYAPKTFRYFQYVCMLMYVFTLALLNFNSQATGVRKMRRFFFNLSDIAYVIHLTHMLYRRILAPSTIMHPEIFSGTSSFDMVASIFAFVKGLVNARKITNSLLDRARD